MNFVGIDIGGTAIKCGIVNDKGEILVKHSIPTLGTRPADEVINDIGEAVKLITKGYEFEGVGIGCPGAIDSEKGIVNYSNNLYWKNVPIVANLVKQLQKPAKVSNDANVAALGEATFGAGRDYSDSVLITLGTGVGSGIVVSNKLFEGYKSMGTEVGHTVIQVGGIECTCGRKGCFEAYASATALIRDTIHAMMINKNSLMWDYVSGDLNKVDGRTSFECSKKGDASALEIVDNYTTYLAEGITNVVNIFRSEAVIMGGGVCGQGKYLTDIVQKKVDERRYGGADSLPVKILTASLGNDAGIVGAAALIFAELKA